MNFDSVDPEHAQAVTLSSSESIGSLDSTYSIAEALDNGSPALEELKRVFETVDEDQDSFICAGDLRHFMSRLGFDISEREALAMLQTVNKAGDGKVTLEEFCTLYQESLDIGEPLSEAEDLEQASSGDDSIHQAFRVFDKDGDGAITARELQIVLLAMGRPEGKSLAGCERMIHGVDTDGNGKIDITEFKHMMSSEFVHYSS